MQNDYQLLNVADELDITDKEWASITEKPVVKQIDNIRITIEYHPPMQYNPFSLSACGVGNVNLMNDDLQKEMEKAIALEAQLN
jgi:hypothetical protein